LKYAFITQHKKAWPVDLMCRLLGVTGNAYYSYCKRRKVMQPDPDHQGMLDAVKEIAEASD
jgi:putative transposase